MVFCFSHIHFMLLATAAYVVCILGIILMYVWYTPQATCLLNIFFITWTLVLLQLMTSVSLHPKVSSTTKMTSIFASSHCFQIDHLIFLNRLAQASWLLVLWGCISCSYAGLLLEGTLILPLTVAQCEWVDSSSVLLLPGQL